ncbi:MAG: hypothetical protein GY869_14290 [Planctomycetes bacterium]|nr:hypothetical protein [Planctomycetota bacterium]
MFSKNTVGILFFILASIFSLSPVSAQVVSDSAAFTFQGRLSQSSQPVAGLFGMKFSLWADPNSVELENQVGLTQVINPVLVTGGIFSVILNRQKVFGEDAFNGEARWLDIAVKGADDPNYIILSPRQPLTAAPYAVTALNPGIRRIQRSTGIGPNETSTGLLQSRQLTFVKSRSDTALRILYSDVFRIESSGSDASGRWSIYIDGEPAPGGGIYKDVFNDQGENIHHPGVIVGYVDDLPAGTYTIQVYVNYTPSFNNGNFWTGWKNSRWVLEAEEVLY